ncbi:MFS transporter, partial [Klebsiella pneumoniae]|nr:MFS transporter [Klebsiella pneumoniae]
LVLALYFLLPPEHSNWLWRASLIFGAVPALLIIFIRGKYLTESPIWLANQGDLKGAAQVLQESYAINAVATVEKVERTAEKKKREGFAV